MFMKNENGNGELSSMLGALGESQRELVVDSATEVDFRLSQFLRAYTGPAPDCVRVAKRARVLVDHLTDLVDLLHSVISSLESNIPPL